MDVCPIHARNHSSRRDVWARDPLLEGTKERNRPEQALERTPQTPSGGPVAATCVLSRS